MAQQLSGLININSGVIPSVKAGEDVFIYPQNSNDSIPAGRPNTMLYGTAPYKGGKGAPSHFIETSDELRPQSTTRFGKTIVQPTEHTLFPVHTNMAPAPVPIPREYASSRADVQNELFNQRYASQ